MTSALAYRPRSLPLQLASPAASIAYLGALVIAAFVFSDPAVLLAVAGAGALAGWLAGTGAAVRAGLRLGVAIAVLLVLINGLVVSRGATVLLRMGEWPLLGRVDVTAEALAAGSVIGLRVVAVTVVLAVYSAAVDPDRVLRALRPLARRSALTAGLVSRLVPLAIADASRLGEAARLRGPGAAPAGRAQLARRLVAGSLDRAVDVAATLELRGYSLDPPRRRRGLGGLLAHLPGGGGGWSRLIAREARRPRLGRSRHDRRFFLAAAAIIVGTVAIQVVGLAGGFQAYPSVQPGIDAGALAAAAAFLTAGLVPLDRGRSPGRSAGRRAV